MTYRAVRQFVRSAGADACFFQVALRMAVALKAPLHEQRVFTPGHRHLIDGSMARGALNSAMHMNAVIEINKTRQIVYTGPLKRSILTIARAHRLERRTVRPHLRVTVHTGLRRWNACKRTVFNRGMAVTTIDSDSRHVMLMTERNRLFAHHARFREIRRTNKHAQDRCESRNDENETKNAETRQCIRAAMENLCHGPWWAR